MSDDIPLKLHCAKCDKPAAIDYWMAHYMSRTLHVKASCHGRNQYVVVDMTDLVKIHPLSLRLRVFTEASPVEPTT